MKGLLLLGKAKSCGNFYGWFVLILPKKRVCVIGQMLSKL